jgi:hypothetical protein
LSFSATLAVKFVPHERRSEKLHRPVPSRRAATPDALVQHGMLPLVSAHKTTLSRRHCVRVGEIDWAPLMKKAQRMPGAGRTHGPPAEKNAGGSHHRFSRKHPAFPARWFDGLLRALPGDRLSCPRVATTRTRVALGASTGTPGPHDFTVRTELFVRMKTMLQPDAPTASHLNVRDGRETPLL